ncbi:Coenzyme F420 hydrogenase/dehydrogenase, beta subunit C-terminal domain [Acetatifactor muris]|uniref:Coenzyme F420 hydrogenase/dehydrogenase, beta subunit C-terminal domain n=1 Tax=Acetatifactor muris TaxID=879566 RepID=UPI0023F041AA|nr:Coenzyme F420 hydrogenase/dehydrogenase, beta subunit C-terminal domain [Acetatifactor muris]
MVTDKVSYSECVGCSACANICPKGIISIKQNNEGFEVPMINCSECIQCGLCEKVCPVLNTMFEGDYPKKGYVVKSNELVVRKNSSSGGVFFELAKQIIKQEGKVVGAIFNEENAVVHYMATFSDEIAKLRQSKYVQSRKGKTFSEIKSELEKGTAVMFVGAPCEVAALKLFLVKNYENLFTCDFICKGAASPKIYEAYLKELEKKYNSKAKIINFREKSLGWSNYSIKIVFENGSVYKKDRYHDWYLRGYIEENLFLRKSCSACKFKGNNRSSDITLADFWGVGKVKRKWDDDLGTSLVITNTAKGEQMLEGISDEIFDEQVPLDIALKGNSTYYDSIIPSPSRDSFFVDIDHNLFSETVKHYAYKGFLAEMKREVRNKLHWIVRKGRILISKIDSQ